MTRHIVTTDDDPAIRKILQIMLRKEGYLVTACEDGNELLALLRTRAQDVDLLLLDIKMPGFTGLELLDMIHVSYPQIPVVMITAFNDLDTGMKAIRMGAVDYLAKPVHRETLVSCVKRVLDHAEQEKQQHAEEDKSKAHMLKLEQELQLALSALKDATVATLQAFSETIEQKDAYTKGHCSRVRTLSVALGRVLNLPPETLEILEGGSLLHDIGKISIPEDILNKTTSLTKEEYAQIKTHPEAGERIISHLPLFKRYMPIVRSHHERIDGLGYPDGLKGDQIPLEVKIVSLADAFDAMTSSRAYRSALPTEIAIEELKFFSGTQFDAELVDLFIEHELYLL
ncbi:MAG: HD domain-containing phosphohydrolase [Sphaerochaeta sp.]|uniref:HD domain-containing phosphohydrolase n=1 Tax=Sphaerochaeta sp. TaxID=1972642 RepID=UPI002FCA118F